MIQRLSNELLRLDIDQPESGSSAQKKAVIKSFSRSSTSDG